MEGSAKELQRGEDSLVSVESTGGATSTGSDGGHPRRRTGHHQQHNASHQHQYTQHPSQPHLPQQHLMQPPPPVYGYAVNLQWNPHHPPYPGQFVGSGYHNPSMLDGVPLPPGIPGLTGASTDPLEAVLGPFPCARLRTLPFDASLEDILVFFQGLVVLDVVIVSHGEAFVLFANPIDFQMALQRDRQTIGRRFVEIYQGSRAEYYEAIAVQHLQEQQRDPQSILKGNETGVTGDNLDMSAAAVWGSNTSSLANIQLLQQPPTTVKSHIGEIPPLGEQTSLGVGGQPLEGLGGSLGVAVGSVAPGPRGRGAGSGRGEGVSGGGRNTAVSDQAAPAAATGGTGNTSGNSSSGPTIVKRSGGGIQVGEHTGFLRMRGLPFSSGKDDIVRFFDGYSPVMDSIVLTYRSDGRATGEAYVGFETPDASKKAMELHRKSMGSRYIELFISNKEEHGRALARFGGR